MTDILLIILIVLSIVTILVSLFRNSKTDDGKIVDTVRLMGDMISKTKRTPMSINPKSFRKLIKT